MADLVRQYTDFPLGTADASVIAVAERLGATRVATIDHRHFRAVAPPLRRLRATARALTPNRPTDNDDRLGITGDEGHNPLRGQRRVLAKRQRVL